MGSKVTVQAIAGADLSASQHLAVYVDGADDERVKLLVSDTSVLGLGFLENDPSDDEVAKITYSGIGLAIAGATVEPYDELMVDNAGRVVVATTGKAIIAKALPPLRGTTATGRDTVVTHKVRVWVYANKTRLLA